MVPAPDYGGLLPRVSTSRGQHDAQLKMKHIVCGRIMPGPDTLLGYMNVLFSTFH